MARINFERVEAAISSEERHWITKSEWARCDLALPVGELRAIAALFDNLDWIPEATEHDCTLMVRTMHDVPWILQERSFHKVLKIARTLANETIAYLKNCTPSERSNPVIAEGSREYGYAYRFLDQNKILTMTEKFKTGFGMAENEEGRPVGYFLTTNHYDDKERALATALLAALYPELSIARANRFERGDVRMGRPGEINPDLAVEAYHSAAGLIRKFKQQVSELQWSGKPSGFTDEDNDAREWLIGEVRNGARIKQAPIEGSGYNDVDGTRTYRLEDGTELAHTIVKRLINAKILKADEDIFVRRKEDEPLPDLVFDERAKPELIGQQQDCVPFQSFQSYCSHRRYDNDYECRHPSDPGDYCSPEHCPLTMQIYREDTCYYRFYGDDDPAFDSHDWERDAQVRAIHPNTKRSRAWLAAGEYAVHAVVNQLINSTYRMGIERHLFGNENMRAVKQAITLGYLMEDEKMEGLGIVVRLSDSLKANIEEQIRQRDEEAREKETV